MTKQEYINDFFNQQYRNLSFNEVRKYYIQKQSYFTLGYKSLQLEKDYIISLFSFYPDVDKNLNFYAYLGYAIINNVTQIKCKCGELKKRDGNRILFTCGKSNCIVNYKKEKFNKDLYFTQNYELIELDIIKSYYQNKNTNYYHEVNYKILQQEKDYILSLFYYFKAPNKIQNLRILLSALKTNSINIFCKCGELLACYDGTLREVCKNCIIPISRFEDRIYEYYNKITQTLRNKFIIKNLQLDIFMPDYSIGIEFNGNYWHSDKKIENDYHYNKMQSYNNMKIKVINIFEHQFNTVSQQNIWYSIINSYLGIYQEININDCSIIELEDSHQFFMGNSISEELDGNINIGLLNNNQILFMMSLTKLGENKYKLLKYCFKINHYIKDAGKIILEYFENNYSPKEITSVINLQWENEELQRSLGFKELQKTPPKYWWTKKMSYLSCDDVTIPNLKKLLKDKYNPNVDLEQNLIDAKFDKVYDCGSSIFLKTYN